MQRAVNSPSSDIGGSNPSRPTGNTRQQGAIGVARAVAYFAAKGYAVFVPVADVCRYDIVVDTGERLLRVEVKTTNSASMTVKSSTTWTDRLG